MKIIHTLTIMFVFSFLIQYFAMHPFMVNSLSNITNNIGKVYLSVIMSLSMVLIEVGMHDMQYGVISSNKYGFIFAFLFLFIYLYRKQVAIKDKEYVKGMIEHHSMAIFMSEEILKKTDNYYIAKLAKNIIQNQKDEIKEMTDLLEKL